MGRFPDATAAVRRGGPREAIVSECVRSRTGSGSGWQNSNEAAKVRASVGIGCEVRAGFKFEGRAFRGCIHVHGCRNINCSAAEPPTVSDSSGALFFPQNPARIGFNGVDDIWVQDVLNIGVDPRCRHVIAC